MTSGVRAGAGAWAVAWPADAAARSVGIASDPVNERATTAVLSDHRMRGASMRPNLLVGGGAVLRAKNKTCEYFAAGPSSATYVCSTAAVRGEGRTAKGEGPAGTFV